MKTLKLSPHVYVYEDKILTINKYPEFKVYGEKIIKKNEKEFRVWSPQRSKLAASILKGLQYFPFDSNSKVLYLGAASGTTASHISDIVKLVFCVEFSPRTARELTYVCERRKNMIPILADASKPINYSDLICEVDVIYQDIAQKNQSEILIKNSCFLKEKGYLFICIKSRSIDVTEEPKKVFRREIEKLKKYFKVLQVVELEPYDKDHVLVVLKHEPCK